MPELRRAGLVLAGLVLLTGCAADKPTNQGGFVGGESSLTRIAPEERTDAPVVSGRTLSGSGDISTADYRGSVIVLNVWGSWCSPCREEADDLQAASAETRGVAQFIGLNTRDLDRANAEAFNRAFGVTYPSIFDPTGQVLVGLAAQVPPKAIPSTLIIDREGRVAARITNTITTLSLVTLIDEVAAGR